jgi:hypothetical protein
LKKAERAFCVAKKRERVRRRESGAIDETPVSDKMKSSGLSTRRAFGERC